MEVESERRYGGGGGHWGAGYVLFLDLSSASKDVRSLSGFFELYICGWCLFYMYITHQ